MTRKLKHHEQKLLRKVDFNTYKSDNDHRETLVMRRYAIQGRASSPTKSPTSIPPIPFAGSRRTCCSRSCSIWASWAPAVEAGES